MWNSKKRTAMSNNNKNANSGECLYANAKRGNWKAVVATYEEDPEAAQKLKLTRQGDTALHLAVVDNQERVVERLVILVRKSMHYQQLLGIRNDAENNALHLAAVNGSARMCHAIASAHEGLVDVRNKDGETPLFLAALHGHRNVFYCLYYFCRSNLYQVAINCRRTDGNTVLHSALRNEYFDLAFQLIHINNDAINWVDGQGFTPLHGLANKPTAFRSGTSIKGCLNIVYYFTCVDRLKPQSIETLGKAWKKSVPKTNTATSYFPANYETCIHFFTRLWDGFLKVISSLEPLVNKKSDEDLEKHVNEESEIVDIIDSNEHMDMVRLVKADDPSESEASITNFPENYTTCINILHAVFSAIMVILGFGSMAIRKIQEEKKKHSWSLQVMEILLKLSPIDKYDHDGYTPKESTSQTYDKTETSPYDIGDEGRVGFSDNVATKPNPSNNSTNVQATESAMLLAAKNGVVEMVKGLWEHFPLAIHDMNPEKKNVVLLAVEYRQPDVYRFLLNNRYQTKSLFQAVDHIGNSALHLAANMKDHKLWRITGAALQMQWEVKWYKYVEESMPLDFFAHYNKEGKTANAIFHESHETLVTKGGEWLYNTSESCSVVATLIATVAFASTVAIPGGTNDSDGTAILGKEEGFFIYTISSLIALCLSSTSVIMFMAILTSRFDAKDFGSNLPWKLLIGLSSLYFSIIATLISFCAGHYFLIIDRLQNIAILLYTLTFLPVALIFGLAQLPLYFDLLQAIIKVVTKRSADVVFNTTDV